MSAPRDTPVHPDSHVELLEAEHNLWQVIVDGRIWLTTTKYGEARDLVEDVEQRIDEAEDL